MLPTFLRARVFGANPLLYLILRLVALVSIGSCNSLHMAGVSAFFCVKCSHTRAAFGHDCT